MAKTLQLGMYIWYDGSLYIYAHLLESVNIVLALMLYFVFYIISKENMVQILIWLFELLQVTYWVLSEIISDLYEYFGWWGAMVSLTDLFPFIHSTNTDVSISVQMVAGFVGEHCWVKVITEIHVVFPYFLIRFEVSFHKAFPFWNSFLRTYCVLCTQFIGSWYSD